MNTRIQRLSNALANQIAAGEVIENPAAALKELVENSIDANAKSIEVTISHGGLQLIQVRDDGDGIHPDDLTLAIHPHATSKVKVLDDLQHIATLGFRGEALASVSAVSRFTLRSKTANLEQAWQLQTSTADKPLLSPIAHPQGTTIDIQDLFFNTPARRRFLRSEKTEWLNILLLMRRLSLSHYALHWQLNHNEKKIFQLPAIHDPADYAKRVEKILGHTFLTEATFFDKKHGDLHLWGWLGNATLAPTDSLQQYFYLNKRFVRDKLLLHAVREAYGDLLYSGRYPQMVLYLEMPHDEVDVNVHPTKHEVRFCQSRTIHDFIVQTLQEVLGTSSKAYASQMISSTWSTRDRADYSDHKTSDDPHEKKTLFPELRTGIPFAMATQHHQQINAPLGNIFAKISPYLLTQHKTYFYLIDFAKVLRYLIHYLCRNDLALQKIISQTLLLPTVCQVQPIVIDRLLNTDLANRLGFRMQQQSPTHILFRAIPTFIRHLIVNEYLEEWCLLLASQSQTIDQAIDFWTDAVVDNIADYSQTICQEYLDQCLALREHLPMDWYALLTADLLTEGFHACPKKMLSCA